ncbi:hypothetical protein DD238_006807 [Peronospora effusa]|uniref:SWIM-type domain-containing protein n=1 Tax=Peronospora effusa TaxID=542832 RepID=A0A3M6VAS1_9STRA|nr:hypothetical protein DD238_006807 [Peronospora effusa]RQM09052.1 hypothetical protein DD237_007019 [Peronospora effusa]
MAPGNSTSPLLPAPTLMKGMRFKDSKTAFYAVQDYALYHNKQVKVDRRGGKHRKMVCVSTEPCPFFVRLYLHNSKMDNTWYVSSANLMHSPECTSTAKPTQRQLVESPTFQHALASTPNGTAAQLLQQLQGRTNLRTIYRAKQIMKRELQTQVGNSFRKIPSLLRNFSDLNPGSFTKYEVGGPQSQKPGTFLRAFVSCNVFTESTTFNQQIYGLDVLPCNNSEANYQGVQIFLLGKDGNMCNVTIAAACCDAPSSENYRWFFRCVEKCGVNLRYCPVLCAIDAELLAVESELGLTLRYCTRYIIEQELSLMGSFSKHHHALVWGLQGSETEMEYNNRLEWIGTTCGLGVESYLRQFPMERWVVAGNIGKVALYGWRSRTFFETSDQEQQAGAGGHGQSGTGVGLGGNCGVESAGVGVAAAAVAPGLFTNSNLYDAQCKRIGEYKVSRASETVAFVAKMNKDSGVRRRVDLQTSTCTCDFIDQYAIPCRHLIAVLLFCEQMNSVVERFAPGYLVENYVMAFRGKVVELPLDSTLSEDPACIPPTTCRTKTRANDSDQDASTVSRQRLKRSTLASNAVVTAVESETQAVNTKPNSAPQRVRLCKKCRGPGHNSRSCSMVIPMVDQSI